MVMVWSESDLPRDSTYLPDSATLIMQCRYHAHLWTALERSRLLHCEVALLQCETCFGLLPCPPEAADDAVCGNCGFALLLGSNLRRACGLRPHQPCSLITLLKCGCTTGCRFDPRTADGGASLLERLGAALPAHLVTATAAALADGMPLGEWPVAPHPPMAWLGPGIDTAETAGAPEPPVTAPFRAHTHAGSSVVEGNGDDEGYVLIECHLTYGRLLQ